MRLFDKKTGSLTVMFFGKPIDNQIETGSTMNIESCVRYSYIQKDNIKTAVDFIKYSRAVIGKVGQNGARIIEATLAQMLDSERYEESDHLYGISKEGDLLHASAAGKFSINLINKESDYSSRLEAYFYQKSDPKITSIQAPDGKLCLLFSVFAFMRYIQTAFSDADLEEIMYHLKAMLSLEFGISVS